MKEDHRERGFVLVSVVVLLAALTILGATAMFKSSIEMSVSAGAVQGEQAMAAANAGLAQNYAYWAFDAGGKNELDRIKTAVKSGSQTDHYYENLTADSITDLANKIGDVDGDGDKDMADVDAWIVGSGVDVYNIQADRMSLGTWGTGGNPQVAVWATSFAQFTGSGYPYANPNPGACADNCNIVVYALGRAGPPPVNGVTRDARRLVREIQVTTDAKLKNVSAMTNAPPYRSWQDMCDGTRTGTGDPFWGTTKGSHGKSSNTAVEWNAPGQTNPDDLLIEATQAEYTTGVIPSGIAMASNTNTGNGGKNFRSGTGSTTVMTFDSMPMIAYSGHGSDTTATGMRVDQANRVQDNSTPALNLPDTPRKLPHKLVNEPLLGTADEINYFPTTDPNEHLFDLDMYRWAAEQFTCQNDVDGDSTNGNGKYCTKARALKNAMGLVNPAPVTGRLNMAEFEYNIANSIPMFGMTRVMYPVYDKGSLGNCASLGAVVHKYDTSGSTSALKIGGTYTGTALTLDGDGSLGPNAKLIVYGSIFFDFFIDMDNDGFFDPGSGERLVNAFEAVDARMELEVPEYINPALPERVGTPLAFPTAAGGTIAVNSSANEVNLASPTDGWFPATEGRIPSSATTSEGAMELVNPLVALGVDMLPVSDQGNGQTFAASGANGLYSSNQNRLEYYYLLMRKTAKQSDPNSWPIQPASAPNSFSENVCIGRDDCNAGNNDGDKFHLLFPSGYMHGWKVSLAALDIQAAEWNDIFSNLPAIAASLDNGGSGYNYGDPSRLKGSPFNTSGTGLAAFSDAGSARALDATDIKAQQGKYFHVTEDAASGYGLLDGDWMDIPGQMYAGGLVDIHHYNNMCGLIYTPGPLEWETSHHSGATGYTNAAIITGFGAFTETADGTPHSKVVLVYDNQAVDNINTKTTSLSLRRFAWQGMQ